MVGNLASAISCRFLLLFLGVLCAAPAISASGSEQATLFIYLEVPADYSLPTQLTVADLVLRSGDAIVPVRPERRVLIADDLAGTQVLWARASLAAGYYDSLIIELGAVTAQAGEATVEAPVRPAGYAVALDVHLHRNEAAVVNLIWQPGSAPGAGKPYDLDIQVTNHPVPPLGSLAFVTERQTGSVIIVDRLLGRVVGAVMVGPLPGGMAYSPLRQKLFVAMAGEDGIGVIDGMTLRLERIVPLSFGDDPDRLALSPDESTLYILNEGSRSLAAMATRSMQEQNRVPVGDGPRSLTVDPETGYIYVACEYEGEVQVFNPSGLTHLTSLLLTGAPVEVAIADASRELYVASSSQNRIYGIGLDDGQELGAMSLCGPARHLIFNPRSRQILAAMPTCSEVAVLRPANGLEFAPYSLPHSPGQMVFDPGFRKLLVVFDGTAALGIYDAHRGTLDSRVEVGGTPYAVVAP